MREAGWGRLTLALIVAGVLAGCAGTTPYTASPDNNVRFTTVTKSGSLLSSVRASVHIHAVDAACRTTYRGTIVLEKSSMTTGIPVGRTSYLVFAFNSGHLLSNSRSSIAYRTLLTPGRGHDYEIAVSYVDNMYDARINQVNRRTGKRREIRRRDIRTCRGGRGKSRGK